MKKALLADDDFLVRSYLKMLTSWGQAGFKIVADVRDGEEALEALEKESVDLVVTDLSMPLMDGIQLITEIRKKYRDIYIIVLSCHDEFEYVKKAMKEGADEYVLKNSLNEESLYTVLEAASGHLERSQGKVAIEEDSKEKAKEEAKKEIKELGSDPEEGYGMNEKFLFFNQILAGTLQGEEREEKRIRAGILGKYKNSAVIVIKKEDTESCEDPLEEAKKEQESFEFYRRMKEKLQERLTASKDNEELVYLGNGIYCCFLDLSEEHKSSVMYQKLTCTSSNCYRICAEEEECYKIGVSNICIGMEALRQAYQQARMMIKYSFYEKDGMAYYEVDKQVGKELPEEACDLLDQVKALQKKKEKREFLVRVEKTVEAFKNTHCDSALIEQWFKKLLRSLQVENVKEEVHFTCIQELEEALDWLADLAFKAEKQALPENISAPVKMAAEYAANHYREDMGLGEAAEAAGVNSSYLSYLFSQEMGTGFANYLLKLRLDHAKKLLRESNMKMWQVAEESGFNDYHYFSKVFKKAEGMSPANYRKNTAE